MAALMTAALTWGNCLLCPQLLVKAAKAGKTCCNPQGHCQEKPGSPKSATQCNLQPVILASAKTPDAAALTLPYSPVPAESALVIPVYPLYAGRPVKPRDRSAPPDLNLLHSVLRI